jgi:2-polyprenyl-6-methoxyphenol hydroxylase-like FAD-dependent oxidoreductase
MVPSIAIVGGGPCGLTLARLLELQGVDYVVYERDESEPSRRTGGSLDLKPTSGQRVVKEAGLFEEFKKYARWDDTLFVLADQQGEKYLEMGEERDAPEIDRVALRKILLDSIPKEKVQWGHELKAATFDEAGTPVLHFTNGSTLSGFKLVVGADGAWSKVRTLVSLAPRPSAVDRVLTTP